jgi:hypothetical protein
LAYQCRLHWNASGQRLWRGGGHVVDIELKCGSRDKGRLSGTKAQSIRDNGSPRNAARHRSTRSSDIAGRVSRDAADGFGPVTKESSPGDSSRPPLTSPAGSPPRS